MGTCSWRPLDKYMSTLQLPDRRPETALPSLYKLDIREPEPCYPPLRKAVAPLMESRWLSGHFIAAEYERLKNSEEQVQYMLSAQR